MNHRSLLATFFGVAILSLSPALVRADAPPAERILPDDTLAMLTVPDWKAMCDTQSRSPQLQLWNDPLMKPFRDHFTNRWHEEVVVPLESELGVEFDDYRGLIQGQLTLGLIKNNWQPGSDDEPGFVVLFDSKDRSEQLAKNLADLRAKWIDKGRSIRTENVRGVEFSVIQLSTNDLPDTLRKFMPGSSDVEELDPDEEGKAPAPRELFIGQSGSLLVLADSLTTAQKIMNRLTGGSLPPLAEVEHFNRDHARLFRDADSFGWVNAAALRTIIEEQLAEKEANRRENAPDPFAQVQADKVISATGLSGLQSAAFAFKESPEGSEVTLFLGVPESQRTGLFSILAGEPKETLPPPFVPADVVEFQRWRLDGQKAYATLEQMLEQISPRMLSGWNFAINTANLAGQEKDPNFDLRRQLVGNLGDDLITYKKAPRSLAEDDVANAPTLFLMGTKNGQQVVAALEMVLSMFLGGEAPDTREFLGTTIYAFQMPNAPMTMQGGGGGGAKFSVAVSRGYVAFTTDDAILEEFLRSADNPVEPLRQLRGLAESTEAVTEPGTSLLSFEDQKQVMRVQLDQLRRLSTNSISELQDHRTPIHESLGVGMPRKGLTDWFDFSLVPPFDQIAKYFYHTVYGGSSSVEGLTMKIFSPTPPELRAQPSAEE